MTEPEAGTTPVVDNRDASRFEARIGADVAIADYVRAPGRITFTHTLVPPHLEGRGIGSRIAKAALDQARAESLIVVPQCPFIADFIAKNPEYRDLVSAR